MGNIVHFILTLWGGVFSSLPVSSIQFPGTKEVDFEPQQVWFKEEKKNEQKITMINNEMTEILFLVVCESEWGYLHWMYVLGSVP